MRSILLQPFRLSWRSPVLLRDASIYRAQAMARPSPGRRLMRPLPRPFGQCSKRTLGGGMWRVGGQGGRLPAPEISSLDHPRHARGAEPAAALAPAASGYYSKAGAHVVRDPTSLARGELWHR